jgi:hypothetical protein
MAVTKEIVLEVGLKDSTAQGTESAKKRLRDLQRALVDLAVAGQENSEEFRRLEAEAGELSDTIGDVSQRVKNLGSDTKNIEAFTQAVQGVAAGFQIAQGAAALFGEENEDIQKAMLQVNATMAIANGIQQVTVLLQKESAISMTANRIATALYDKTVKGTTISLKAFRTALAATGVGLAVVGAAIVYENWEKLRELLGLPPNNSKAIAALEREIALMEANGKMIESIEAKKIQLIKLQAEEMKGQEKLNKLNEIGVITAQAQIRAKQDEIATKEKAIATSERELEVLQSQYVKGEENATAQIELAQKIYAENESLYQQRRLLAQSQQELDQLEIDEKNRKAEILSNLDSQLQEDAKKDYDVRNQLAEEQFRDEIDKAKTKGILLESQLDEERVQRLAAAKLALGDTEAYLTMEKDINARFDAAKINQKQLTEEEISKIERERRQQDLKMASEAVGALGDLLTAGLGKSEKDQRKAFEINKKASMGQALINTFMAVTAALTAGGNPIKLATGRQFIDAGIALATGLAQVAKISKTQFQGSSASGGGGALTAGGGGGGEAAPAPIFANPQTTMLGTDGAAMGQGQGSSPMRAYVVERDITQSTRRVRRLEEFATLGA